MVIWKNMRQPIVTCALMNREIIRRASRDTSRFKDYKVVVILNIFYKKYYTLNKLINLIFLFSFLFMC